MFSSWSRTLWQKQIKKKDNFVINLEKYRTIVTLGGHLRRAIKNVMERVGRLMRGRHFGHFSNKGDDVPPQIAYWLDLII